MAKADREYSTEPGLTEWARGVMSQPVEAVLATINPDGTPHAVPVAFMFDGERIFIPSGARTRKVRNLEADPRARVLVMAPAETTGIDDGWVAADGTAEILRGDDAREHFRLFADTYLTDEGRRGYEEVFLPILDVTIVVSPRRWHSWTEAGMLETMREHGYTAEDAERWYIQP